MVNPWYNCVWSAVLKMSALHPKKIQRDVLRMALLCRRSWSNGMSTKEIWREGRKEEFEGL